ncbi:hypothetical protein V492_00838 [Pseudogymnoascus sp. VKM F-4246]|nr:hypothetical protein V492_00838 [Pseudogymnoascus sp. VKM F-4246]
MSERSCPVSASVGSVCPMGNGAGGNGRARGCNFASFSRPEDVHSTFGIPPGADVADFLRQRERKAINELLYSDVPSMPVIKDMQNAQGTKSLDSLNVNDQDLLAVALGAPARQVLLRAEEVGPRTGWRDGYLSREHGFCPPDADEAASALARSPGRVWSDICERMPGCVARGRVRQSIAALPHVEGTPDIIPDKALWAALVSLGMLCSIYRYEETHNGTEGVNVSTRSPTPNVEMSDDYGDEVKGIPKCIGLAYVQISRRMGRSIPHLTFYDQASYNIKVRDPTSTYPYIGRFDNTDLRWPMFGVRSEIAFLKGCADTSASFQHGVDAIASCQEYVMSKNKAGLLRALIRLKEILERMPNAFHSISLNPSSGENFVSPPEWVRWAKFSAPLSKRCPATSGLQFPPYLVMDAFLGRTKYESFLGEEGLHLRAWLPSNWRAFIAAVEYHYSIPDFVNQSGDPRLMGAFDGIVEAYTGERGFMGTHRYKVFGLLEIAGKTGRAETNGNSGSAEVNAKPHEETHKAFSDAMKERLEPHRGNLHLEPNEMRGSFAECRYKSTVLSRSLVDSDPERSIARVIIDIQDTGITFQPGDRLAIMPLNSWLECAKVAAALGLDIMLDSPVFLDSQWNRFADHLGSVSRTPTPRLTVKDILRRGHLAPLTKDLVMKLHTLLRASSNTVLQILATTEWPVRASLGDLLQAAVTDTPSKIWDQAFDISGNLSWLPEIVPLEVPRTYSISNYPDEMLPSTVELTVSRSEYNLCPTLGETEPVVRYGVGSGFLNPPVSSQNEFIADDEELLIGVSRPLAFQLPIDDAAPCAFFAGGSGIAPFRSFWQSRAGRSVGKNLLFLGVQSREKFCYENELREYVNAGYMEVYTAFSRDSRGLNYDSYLRDLVEKETPPRYIDSLIVEQGAMVCDLVMSKKQGGLGGYLYVCGSLSVFDSVMSGIRKAIYNHRTASMESTNVILDTAFAERRFMLDVFMSPKPLPCNIPTILPSQLAMHTGHRPNSRIRIAVHGSVYDVTDFCPMHPGGTMIIQSNAGADCSKSFDLLAHSNNPEVSSLLNKYFIGHLTPKPNYRKCEEISMLYDLWSDYLRTSVETLVGDQFETRDFMDSTNIWFQGSLFNMSGVRSFYQHQSRLLQNGFSALFGAKLQELYLKLSFTLANSGASSGQLPDVLGIIGRAKSSPDAMATSNEVSQIGKFTCDSETARFHERGIIEYVKASVQLNLELLEGIREEACCGMDAFDTIMDLEVSSETQRLTSLSTFLLQLTERMAIRLEGFYSKLAQHSIYHPEMEHNPARTRWNLVRRKVRDGSFFILTQNVAVNTGANYVPRRGQEAVEFDHVITQIQHNISKAPIQVRKTMELTEQHIARGRTNPNGVSANESHENGHAMKRMSSFVNNNMRAIRRLSKLPAAGVSLEQLMNTYGHSTTQAQDRYPAPMRNLTPNQSRSPSVSRERDPFDAHQFSKLNVRGRSTSNADSLTQGSGHSSHASSSSHLDFHLPMAMSPALTPPSSAPPSSASSPVSYTPASAALPSMLNKMNRRKQSNDMGPSLAGLPENHMRKLMQSSATAKANLNAPFVTANTQRDHHIRGTQNMQRAAVTSSGRGAPGVNQVNPQKSSSQPPHRQGSHETGDSFLETSGAEQLTWNGEITSMDYGPPNGQNGQHMPSQNVSVASEHSSNHSTPLSTDSQSCASATLSNRTIGTAATSNQSPKDLGSPEQAGQLVPDEDFNVIRDRWLYPYIEPSPLSYALREQSMFYICRVFRTYPRMMARRERLPPMIHPMQASKEIPLPLKNCFSITRMWEGGAEEASSLVQGTIEREMDRLFAEFRTYDEETLITAFQALVIYAIILLFPTPQKPTTNNLTLQTVVSLQEVGYHVGQTGLMLRAEAAHVRPTWDAWILVNAKRRTMCALYCLEWIYAMLNKLPTFPCTELGFMPTVCSKALWDARTKDEWEASYNCWLARWTVGGGYLMRELMAVQPGPELDQRTEMWLEEVDEFGMMYMSLVNATEVPGGAGGAELRPGHASNEA